MLHVAPESAVGGPLAVVRTGDEIELDVAARARTAVPEEEIERRLRVSTRPRRITSGGMAGCSWSTSHRRTWAAISIF